MSYIFKRVFDFYFFDENVKDSILLNELKKFVEKSWANFDVSIEFEEFNKTNFLLCKRNDFRIKCSFYPIDSNEYYDEFYTYTAPNIKIKPTGKIRLILKSLQDVGTQENEYIDINIELNEYFTSNYTVFLHDLDYDDATFCNLEGHYINYP